MVRLRYLDCPAAVTESVMSSLQGTLRNSDVVYLRNKTGKFHTCSKHASGHSYCVVPTPLTWKTCFLSSMCLEGRRVFGNASYKVHKYDVYSHLTHTGSISSQTRQRFPSYQDQRRARIDALFYRVLFSSFLNSRELKATLKFLRLQILWKINFD